MFRSKFVGAVTVILLSTTTVASANAQIGDLLRRVGSGSSESRQGRDRSQEEGEERRARPSTRTVVGTAACAGIGGLLGRAIFGRDSEIGQIATAVVAGAFCFSLLSKKDNEELKKRSEELIRADGPSKTVWIAPESGEEVTIETQEAKLESKRTEFQYNAAIAKPQAQTIVEAKTYVVVASRLNFRSAPTTTDDANIIGYFDRDDNVEVIGFTPDRNWALVGSNGVIVGYAAVTDGTRKLLATPQEAVAIRVAQAEAEAARIRDAKQRKAAVAAAKQREAARKKERAAPKALDGTTLVAGRVVKTNVSASLQCKSQVARNGSQAQKRTGCVLPNGDVKF